MNEKRITDQRIAKDYWTRIIEQKMTRQKISEQKGLLR
jgi:hypothetical protein